MRCARLTTSRACGTSWCGATVSPLLQASRCCCPSSTGRHSTPCSTARSRRWPPPTTKMGSSGSQSTWTRSTRHRCARRPSSCPGTRPTSGPACSAKAELSACATPASSTLCRRASSSRLTSPPSYTCRSRAWTASRSRSSSSTRPPSTGRRAPSFARTWSSRGWCPLLWRTARSTAAPSSAPWRPSRCQRWRRPVAGSGCWRWSEGASAPAASSARAPCAW
mmetsp:Transcript_2677/g.10665  ORF Transcript_2677/g.10665 Transcript_2677/m.10665 type:complete len:222 (-) Transcript_2677:5716-6381(-)